MEPYLRNAHRGVWLSVLTFIALCIPAQGARYYLDSTAGDDARSGLSPAESWRSLNKANATTFRRGDELLLKRGGRWAGTLQPQGSGTPEQPIRLAAYGEGPRPFIDGGTGPAKLILITFAPWLIAYVIPAAIHSSVVVQYQ